MSTATRSCPSCQTPLPEAALFCLHCGTATPTEPGVPARTAPTDVREAAKVRAALGERYQVDRILGEGGMATVYLAEDLKHKRKVAVKVMRDELAATLGADRFLREVEIAAQLSHPHILPMYDSGASEGILYYVMPYVEGESLQDRIRREGQLPLEDAVRLAREVSEALAHAHERGIIHRDIKPANIMLSAGHALVADFGIARAVGAGGEALTKTGLAVGTPQYMSPEQATGAEVDGRADIYAIGSVLYEMLAGEAPFTGPTAQAIMARSLTEAPRPLSASREIPAQVEAVVKRAMAKSPADRQPSAAALAEALGAALDASRSGATPVPAGRGPTPVQVWGLFAFTTVLSLGVVYGLVQRQGLPRWTFGLAVALLAIGAVVLVQTGRIELRRRQGERLPGLSRLLTWRNAAVGGGLALALWAVLATGLVVAGPGAAVGGSGNGIRLAVLPFENRGSSDDAYFADGITDEIRGKLTGLPGFQVTARASSDQYRESSTSLQQIGKELGVEYLLTATVRWAKTPNGQGRVQVVPELIDARTGAATWQQTFDADVTDVFQVQSNIAIRVAGALGVALGSNEERQITQRPTENLAAYDLYLKGLALTASDPTTLKVASGYFEQAAALDSTFVEAWARLSGSLSVLYNNGTPDPAIGARAREAADRALALDPSGAPGHTAMATYNLSVMKNVAQAEEEMALALRASPNDPEMLQRAGGVEQSLGRWDDALTHLEQARRLDPRSVPTLAAATAAYLYVRRYSDALAAGSELLALAPSDPNNIQRQAMVYLAQGDLAAAQAVIKASPGSLAEPALVAYLATYNDLYWVLDDAQQKILLRLPPSAFFDDPAAWGSVFMQTWWHRGDKTKARAYADTAHTAFLAQLRGAPDDPQLHVLDGLALAYMGKKTEAIAEGERGAALLPVSKDARTGPYFQHQLVRIYIMSGEYEKALDTLEPLLRIPYFLSPGWLRIDPTFEPLKGNPRFERLIAGN